MDSIILTPRLKLTLITGAERGSRELEWLHLLRSNQQTTFWSIHGQQKTIEETEKVIKGILPTRDEAERSYRVVYAVHKILESANDQENAKGLEVHPSEFIGVVNITSLGAGNLPLPPDFVLPVANEKETLTVELAYMFLPTGWGQGYATESVQALFEACKRVHSFWEPFPKLYVRAIVNSHNPASMRVMEKIGMWRSRVLEWSGKPIFIGGEWRTEDKLWIYGKLLLE